jgi:hypothetical protein
MPPTSQKPALLAGCSDTAHYKWLWGVLAGSRRSHDPEGNAIEFWEPD